MLVARVCKSPLASFFAMLIEALLIVGLGAYPNFTTVRRDESKLQ
jgi:hypothetical protein